MTEVGKQAIDKMVEEEIQLMLENGEIDEGMLDRLRARAAAFPSGIKSSALGLASRAAGKLGAKTASKEIGQKAGTKQADATRKKIYALRRAHGRKIARMHKRLQAILQDALQDAKKLGLAPQIFGDLSAAEAALADQVEQLTGEIAREY